MSCVEEALSDSHQLTTTTAKAEEKRFRNYEKVRWTALADDKASSSVRNVNKNESFVSRSRLEEKIEAINENPIESKTVNRRALLRVR